MLMWSLALPLFAQNSATVEKASGKVEMQSPGGSWRAVSAGDTIPLGATISTGFRSEALLQVGTATLEVKPLTRMRLDELIEREGVVQTELFLRVGRVRAEVKPREGLQQDFKLKSPVSTAAVRGTSFFYDGVNIQVITGLVAMGNSYGQTSQIGQGEESSTDGFSLPPGGLEALEQMFNIPTGASGLEGMIQTFLPPMDSFGTVTVNWTIAQ
jgi:hypothetical protein